MNKQDKRFLLMGIILVMFILFGCGKNSGFP